MDIFETVLRLTDAAIPGMLAMRQKDPAHRDYNGQISPGKGFAEPGAANSAAATFIAAYFCPNSKYHKNEAIMTAAVGSLEFLLARCHEDGTIDLMETNFHDGTCNAFCVQTLGFTYRLLEKEADTSLELKAKDLVWTFLQTSAKAIMNGGFHTPNHRWVMASALSLCANILKDERCAEMAKIYLSEDVDQNGDGDYTERSAGVYDAVCNESLCIIAEELNMPELYGYVEHNLEMTVYYMEPDFTVLTMASRRQDYGKDVIPVRNFLPALLLYRKTGDKNALVLANALLRQMDALELKAVPPMKRFGSLNHQNLLARFLLSTGIAAPLPADDGIRTRYEKAFDLAGIARYRHEDFTLTLIRDNPALIKIQNGHLKTYIRLAASFFGKGKLCAQSIEKIEGGYRCLYKTEKGYYRPVENLHEKNWFKIDHSMREIINVQYLSYQVDVFPSGNSVTLKLDAAGTPDIPLKVEFIFEPDGVLRTAGTTLPGTSGGYAISGERFTYERFGEKLTVDGGFNRHEYAPNMRGSDPIPQNSFCVFFTGFTPLDTELKIIAEPYTEI